MASRSEPWLDGRPWWVSDSEEELGVVCRVPIAMTVALEVVQELQARDDAGVRRHLDRRRHRRSTG